MQVCARISQRVVVSTIVVALLTTLCISSAVAASRQMLWQSRDQFVALESQEQAAEAPNAHPAEIAPEMLTALLERVEVRTEDNAGAAPLFTQAALQALVPPLHQALRTAKAREDVTFAVIGLHNSLYGLAKRAKVTTGRIFKSDGRLNLILGMVQQDFNEREDRRLAPFVPGSRKQASAGTWRIVQQPDQDLFSLKRNDWLVFTDAPPLPAKTPEPLNKTLPQQPPPASPVPSRQAPGESRNPVERMTILKELRDKGLISDEEYRDKRQQILNGL